MLDAEDPAERHLDPALHNPIGLVRSVGRIRQGDVVRESVDLLDEWNGVTLEDTGSVLDPESGNVGFESMETDSTVLHEIR